jgi:hypothetical protein
MGSLRTRIAKLEGIGGKQLVCILVEPKPGETQKQAEARTLRASFTCDATTPEALLSRTRQVQ